MNVHMDLQCYISQGPGRKQMAPFWTYSEEVTVERLLKGKGGAKRMHPGQWGIAGWHRGILVIAKAGGIPTPNLVWILKLMMVHTHQECRKRLNSYVSEISREQSRLFSHNSRMSTEPGKETGLGFYCGMRVGPGWEFPHSGRTFMVRILSWHWRREHPGIPARLPRYGAQWW